MKHFLIIALALAGCIERPPAEEPPDTGVGATDVGRDLSTLADADESDDIGARPDFGRDADIDLGRVDTAPPIGCAGLGAPPGYWSMDVADVGKVPNRGAGAFPALALNQAMSLPGDFGSEIRLRGDGTTRPTIERVDAFDLEEGTISVWVRPTPLGLNNVRGIFTRDALGQDDNGHMTIELRNGRPSVRLQALVEQEEITSDEPVPGDAWSHVAVVFADGRLELWVDGVRKANSANGWGIVGNPNPGAVGFGTSRSGNGSSEPSNEYFDGSIDELTIWDRALSDDEIVLLSDADCELALP